MTADPARSAAVAVRPVTDADHPSILELASRLAGAANLPWRDPGDIARFQEKCVSDSLQRPAAGAATFVATDPDGGFLGFVHLEPARDLMTGAAYGYVSLLAVAERAEGQGIARRLLAEAEDWARGKGYPFLGLNVFASNTRARGLYDRLGYAEESLKLVKPLGR